ncbi:hypothetical protein KSF_084630 [Reticulibacter mediterranei]|uniref:Uncharacterized protein n=1 Tax=Reticulibacter mediterranei TaxID=2778369 RepID=A0A8J3IX31_9CHLR|nr:hypothetical protein [Reticulibacter mediterranei]GHO98415.1 hypothetical protein KSF_084630 [Reticulibacter mediterranei]
MNTPDDLEQLGFGGSAMSRYDLNLAGSSGIPTPDQLVQRSLWDGPQPVDYGTPDFSVPTLQDGDLTGAELNIIPAFTPDPTLPDLSTIPRPFAVNMSNGMEVELVVAQDIPDDSEIDSSLFAGAGFSGLSITRDIRQPDPSMPDLQHPQVQPQIMNERPGDLDPDALDVMHTSAQYEQIRAKKYPAVQMDQQGMNNRRSRKFTLLMKGLDSEEQGR